MRRSLLGTLILGICLLMPQKAAGQACGPQTDCIGSADHKVSCPAGFGVLNCHSYCAECLYGECHPPCQVSSLWSVEENKRYASLLRLADALDINGLIAEARRVPGRVFYNAERAAVQLVGCDGFSIAANLPIESASGRQVAVANLPDASQIGSFAMVGFPLVTRSSEQRVFALRGT